MKIFDRLFSSHKSKSIQKSDNNKNNIYIYIDTDLKRKIQTHNQTVQQYMNQNQFDQDQFLYILLKNKKNDQIYSKRKLNPYQSFIDCIQNVGQQFKTFIVMGYQSKRNSLAPRLSLSLPLSDTKKCIRSGSLLMYSQLQNVFEQCQLKLHHDYLTYLKVKAKQKKVSFIPLQNSIIQTVSQNKYVFVIKDKFKNIIFKTTSKQDMIGWLLAISEAIKIRSSQIYLNQFDQKLSKSIKQKINLYNHRCYTLKQQSKLILLDQIGRKAIRSYLTNLTSKQTHQQTDIKILKIIQLYIQMCKLRRQKGQSYCQQMILKLKQQIKQIFQLLPEIFKSRQLSNSNHQFIKVIQDFMKYLDKKYKKQLIDKKILQHFFQRNLTQDYKRKSLIPVKTFFGHIQVNKNSMNVQYKQDLSTNNDQQLMLMKMPSFNKLNQSFLSENKQTNNIDKIKHK